MSSTFDPDYATIGGLLLAPDQFDTVHRWLRPEDFTRPLCGEIYQLIGTMRARAVPVDPVTVLGELRLQGRVRADGYPANELLAMVETVPVPGSVPYYARLVLSAAVFRRIDEYGARLRSVGRSACRTPDEAFEMLAAGWRSVADVHGRWQQAGDTTRAHCDLELGLARTRESASPAQRTAGITR
jgi:replicative DNA helicase